MKIEPKGLILVVDDEETMRRSLAEILRLEGYQVYTASSGEEAVEVIRKESFDLILLDLKMPGMDGLDVFRFAAEVSPETQVVMLTAHGSLESAVEALRLEAQDYLLKPVSPKQILACVEKALQKRAEGLHKRKLIEQLGQSLSELRKLESGEKSHPRAEGNLPLGQGVYADLIRREIWLSDAGETSSAPQKITLTPTEARLLQVLYENRGMVLAHRVLVQKVQGYAVTEWEAPEVLRPLVSRLRQKLAAFPGGGLWIRSVRGVGYVWESGGG